MIYDYDEEKNKINKRKHGVDFEEAITVFEDQNILIKADLEHSQDEERFIAIGYSKTKKCLFVVFCEVQDEWGDITRIISARKVERFEREIIKAQENGEHGFVRPTETERQAILNSKFVNCMGRPKKDDEEKMEVESIRFSEIEKKQLIKAAKKSGFLSWKKYVKYVALEQAKKSA